jgi:hypothetical protein
MSAPGVIIELRLEERPRIRIDAMTEGQALRLAHWLEWVEEIHSLLDHAETVIQAWHQREAA